MNFINRYIGTYTLFYEKLLTGEIIIDEELDEPEKRTSYLQGKYGIQVYRYNKDKLGIMFLTTNSSNSIIPKLNDLGVQLTPLAVGDQESIYLFDEKHVHQIHSIVRFVIKGKNEQLKEHKKKLKEMKAVNKSNKKLK